MSYHRREDQIDCHCQSVCSVANHISETNEAIAIKVDTDDREFNASRVNYNDLYLHSRSCIYNITHFDDLDLKTCVNCNCKARPACFPRLSFFFDFMCSLYPSFPCSFLFLSAYVCPPLSYSATYRNFQSAGLKLSIWSLKKNWLLHRQRTWWLAWHNFISRGWFSVRVVTRRSQRVAIDTASK